MTIKTYQVCWICNHEKIVDILTKKVIIGENINK